MLSSATLALAEILSTKLPDQFSRKVLDGSVGIAWDSANPIRANLFAAGMRELVTYVLHLSAPDHLLTACAWYSAHREDQRKKALKTGVTYRDAPTRVNRMVYATQGGLSDKFLEEFGIDSKSVHRRLREVVDDLSRYTHVRPGLLLESDSEVSTFMADIFQATIHFFDVVSEVRDAVASAVAESISEAVDAALTETVVDELDELSTHTMVNEVVADSIKVSGIGPSTIEFDVDGTVYVQLNYGSHSDFARGDGASMSDKYPFAVKMAASVSDLRPYFISRVAVDNRSFYE